MDKPVKPISIRRKEFTDDLAKLINKSNLPPIFLIDILESALGILRTQQAQNEDAEQREYEEKLKAYERTQAANLAKENRGE